jgi:hypothetical protein
LPQRYRTCAGKHLVDADDVVWMCTHAHVEAIFAAKLCQSLVGGNTSSLEGLAGQLFALIRDKVYNGGELVDWGLFVANIVNAKLRICSKRVSFYVTFSVKVPLWR